jgi:hypothetical protein
VRRASGLHLETGSRLSHEPPKGELCSAGEFGKNRLGSERNATLSDISKADFGGAVQSHEREARLFSLCSCDTGEQTFTSLEAMCVGLESASLNSGCALNSRQAFFVSESCAGAFQETP